MNSMFNLALPHLFQWMNMKLSASCNGGKGNYVIPEVQRKDQV